MTTFKMTEVSQEDFSSFTRLKQHKVLLENKNFVFTIKARFIVACACIDMMQTAVWLCNLVLGTDSLHRKIT